MTVIEDAPILGPLGSPDAWSLARAAAATLLLLSASLLALVRIFLERRKSRPPFEGVPLAPGGHWLTGHLAYILGDYGKLSHIFVDHASEDGLSSFYLANPVVSVLDAGHARNVLRYSSSRRQMPFARRHVPRALGCDSLIFLEGGHPWMRQRRVVNYAFSAVAMEDYRPAVFEVAGRMVASLGKMCEMGERRGRKVEVNVSFLALLFTMDVFGKIAFGHDFGLISDSDDYGLDSHRADEDSCHGNDDADEKLRPVQKSPEIKAIEFTLDDLALRLNPSSVFNISLQCYWMPTQRNRLRKIHHDFVKSFLTGIARDRRDQLDAEDDAHAHAHDVKRDNMLTRFLRANEGATDADLSESLKTLLVAGYETTAVTISWALYNLSMNTRCQERCAEEARRVFAKHEPGSVIDEREFGYVYASLMESMRLTPTIIMTQRQCTKTFSIGEAVIPEGCTIMLPVSSIMRSERNFARADEFCPERWVEWKDGGWAERDRRKEIEEGRTGSAAGPMSSNSAHREQNALAETVPAGNRDHFLAFGHGVRDCVGKRLALLKTTVCIAHVLRDFAVEYDAAANPSGLEMKRRLTTFFPHHLPIVFRKRS